MNVIAFLNLKKMWSMNIKNKLIKLINYGLSDTLLGNLNESQINLLYNKLNEQVTPVTIPAKTGYVVKGSGKLPPSPKGYTVDKNPDGSIKATPNESKSVDGDMNEKFESKAQQKYFWSKCNRSKGKEKEKWCSMAKEFSDSTSKKQYEKMPEKKHPEKTVKVKEGSYKDALTNTISNSLSRNLNKAITPKFVDESEIERKISLMVEKHLTPKMSKKDLVDLVRESEVAPVKPKTPTKPKERPKTPYNPKPGPKPSPKAETNEQPSPTIAPPKPKTPTKPSKPGTPYSPKPGPKPAPKASDKQLPNWLKFDKLKIDLK